MNYAIDHLKRLVNIYKKIILHDLMLILELFYRIMIKNEEKRFCEMFVVSTFERLPTPRMLAFVAYYILKGKKGNEVRIIS